MPGSGLGLSIVRDVAERHGGRVFARNRAGGGAVVGFRLVVVARQPSAAIVRTASACMRRLVGRQRRPELDDEGDRVVGGELGACPRGGDPGVGAARDAAHRQPGELGIACPDPTFAALGGADHVEVLVVPDRDVGPELGDEVHHRLRLGFAGRPGTGVLAVTGRTDRAPFVGKVAIEVDGVGVVPVLGGLAVGVHRLDQPQLDVVRRAGPRGARRRSPIRRPRCRGSRRSRALAARPGVPNRSATIGTPSTESPDLTRSLVEIELPERDELGPGTTRHLRNGIDGCRGARSTSKCWWRWTWSSWSTSRCWSSSSPAAWSSCSTSLLDAVLRRRARRRGDLDEVARPSRRSRCCTRSCSTAAATITVSRQGRVLWRRIPS